LLAAPATTTTVGSGILGVLVFLADAVAVVLSTLPVPLIPKGIPDVFMAGMDMDMVSDEDSLAISELSGVVILMLVIPMLLVLSLFIISEEAYAVTYESMFVADVLVVVVLVVVMLEDSIVMWELSVIKSVLPGIISAVPGIMPVI
jgi:hypothetical protein